ncbi:MAG: 1-(5-phosphoribosyl)-5-[(5-phosphoribosylamino)methylideneamino]imidazole-4-carboxamide isomerase [Ignavibacteriaceae bacterium]|nr:1-(5-phosphoribosyl)-5-[(5-phosphoribosylamino)methylideneamino]imidazole-4-carboxamide isomerase [Ignavibacteriaceae bacterium]
MLIIPAIDLYENKIVRLRKGDFNQVTFYKQTPLEKAKKFEQHGFEWLHIVDLLGSKTGTISVEGIIREIKKETILKIEFGGGVRNSQMVSQLFEIGIDKIILGSISVKNKIEFESIVTNFPPQNFIIAVDALDEMIAVSGWTESTAISIYEHIKYCLQFGLTHFLCTDISKDGMLTGTNIELYKNILARFPNINLIASGGIKDLDDVKKVNELKPYGVVIGKAIYENKIDLKELAQVGR